MAQKVLAALEMVMAAPGLMLLEPWEACPGPSSHQRRMSSTLATERQDTVEGLPAHPKDPDLTGPGSVFLFLSNLVQWPLRKPQNDKLRRQQVRPRDLGAAGHGALPCLM